MAHRRFALLMVVASLSFAACSRTPPPDRVQASVAVAPPAPRREVAGRRPHPNWVWVSGYWNWVNGQHVWVPGFWAVPPRGSSSWDAAHWVHDKRQGWVLVRGRWK